MARSRRYRNRRDAYRWSSVTLAAAAVRGLFPVLGDNSPVAMLAGNAVELVAVRFDLFRQSDHTFAAAEQSLAVTGLNGR